MAQGGWVRVVGGGTAPISHDQWPFYPIHSLTKTMANKLKGEVDIEGDARLERTGQSADLNAYSLTIVSQDTKSREIVLKYQCCIT